MEMSKNGISFDNIRPRKANVSFCFYEKREIRTKFWSETLKGTDHFGDIAAYGTIIIK
jgi:hypothetical protein